MKKKLIIIVILLLTCLSACSVQDNQEKCNLQIEIEGDGVVEGGITGEYIKGTYFALVAKSSSKEKTVLAGWYVNGTYNNKNSSYGFYLNEDTVMVAKFVDSEEEEPLLNGQSLNKNQDEEEFKIFDYYELSNTFSIDFYITNVEQSRLVEYTIPDCFNNLFFESFDLLIKKYTVSIGELENYDFFDNFVPSKIQVIDNKVSIQIDYAIDYDYRNIYQRSATLLIVVPKGSNCNEVTLYGYNTVKKKMGGYLMEGWPSEVTVPEMQQVDNGSKINVFDLDNINEFMCLSVAPKEVNGTYFVKSFTEMSGISPDVLNIFNEEFFENYNLLIFDFQLKTGEGLSRDDSYYKRLISGIIDVQEEGIEIQFYSANNSSDNEVYYQTCYLVISKDRDLTGLELTIFTYDEFRCKRGSSYIPADGLSKIIE